MTTLHHLCLLSLLVGSFTLPAGAQCTTTGTVPYWEPTWAGCVTPAVLTSSANPVLGSVISLHTANLPASTLLVATMLLLPPTPLGTPTTNVFSFPLVAGCLNYLPNATDYVVVFPFGGAADVHLGIPNALAWLDKVLHCQSVILTVGSGIELEMSNGICLHTGQ